MPTEYIDQSLIKEFTKKTGIKVSLITFDSNEVALSTIEQVKYDLVIPSDYAIEELVNRDLINEIDWSRITTLTKSDFPDSLNSAISKYNNFDLLKYSIPYFYGNVGILYDKTQVDKTTIENQGWNSLKTVAQTKRVMLYDSSRDMFMVALKEVFHKNGTSSTSSINNPTDTEFLQAVEFLNSMKGSNAVYQTDQIFDDMVEKPTKSAMAVSYSGDAFYLMNENENLDFYVPNSGTNVFIDAFVIPKNAVHEDDAYEFINFFSSYEINKRNAEETCYTSIRLDVIESLLEDETFTSLYLIKYNEFDEPFRYNKALKEKMTSTFETIRT
jgi:spermidine/putrescine transport system substrate-binding protein